MQEENKVKKSFFQNMKAELKKVIWPTGKQTAKNTFATIVFVLLVSLALIVFNLLFEFLKTNLWYNPIFNRDDNAVVISGDLDSASGEATENIVLDNVLSGETAESGNVAE